MKPLALVRFICAQAIVSLLLTYPSFAFDLSGKWSTDAAVCEKIFGKVDSKVTFKRNSGLYGNGFIVEGNLIRGQMSKCSIKTTKEVGAVTHLIAVCASDVLLDQVQISFKVVDDNNIVRLFPGIDGMERAYSRCK